MLEKNIAYKRKVDLVLKYYELHKRLPTKYIKNDPNTVKLSNFLNNQKYLYKKNKLSNFKIMLLQKIPKFLNIVTPDDKFDKNIKLILEYYEKYKKLPTKHDNDKNIKKLGNFINNYRTFVKNNEISNERIEKLNKIPGFFNVDNEQKFKNKVKQLSEYYEKYQKIPKYDGKDKTLYLFFYFQIKLYKKGQLSEERYNLMCSIPPFIEKINNVYISDFDNKINLIKSFYDKNKRLPSLKDDKKLSKFLYNQKTSFTKNKMPEYKLNKLCLIPTFKERLIT